MTRRAIPAQDDMPPLPSVGRILRRDWPSFGLSAFVGLCWLTLLGGYIAIKVFRPDLAGRQMIWLTAGIVAVLTSTIMGGVVLVRILRIRGLFARGVRVPGRIVELGQNTEDVHYAVIEFTIGGQKQRVTSVIEGLSSKDSLAVGESIDMIVDAERPSRACIAHLFDV